MEAVLKAWQKTSQSESTTASKIISYRSGSTLEKVDPPSPIDVPETLTPAFLEQCQQELARSIGPIASIVLKKAQNQYPQATPQRFVEVLAANIPNPQQAEEFKQNLL